MFLVVLAVLCIFLQKDNTEKSPVLKYNEETQNYCFDGQCYPPWMTKEEVEADIAKRLKEK